MGFFERFIPKSNKIEKDNTSNLSEEKLTEIGFKKEFSLEDTKQELSDSFKAQEIITEEDPTELNKEEVGAIEKASKDNVDVLEKTKNNIDIWHKNIERNLEKIKQYELSIQRTKEELKNSENSEVALSVEKLTRMRNSLLKQTEEMRDEIKNEENKIEARRNEFYNLN